MGRSFIGEWAAHQRRPFVDFSQTLANQKIIPTAEKPNSWGVPNRPGRKSMPQVIASRRAAGRRLRSSARDGNVAQARRHARRMPGMPSRRGAFGRWQGWTGLRGGRPRRPAPSPGGRGAALCIAPTRRAWPCWPAGLCDGVARRVPSGPGRTPDGVGRWADPRDRIAARFGIAGN